VRDNAASPRVGYRTALDWLHRLLSPDWGLGMLVATMEDGTTRRIRAAAASGNYLLPGAQDAPGFRAFSIALASPDPAWYGQWGTLTADSGRYADWNGLKWGHGWDWRADDSEELVLRPNTSPQTFTFDTLSPLDVERVRVVGYATNYDPLDPGTTLPWSVTVVENGTGFSATGAFLRAEADNIARTVTERYGIGGGEYIASSVRDRVTLNSANRGGELIRLPAGTCTLDLVGFQKSEGFQSPELRIQWFPTF
jgi:hypothetical protein